jgi:hypothetical protein
MPKFDWSTYPTQRIDGLRLCALRRGGFVIRRLRLERTVDGSSVRPESAQPRSGGGSGSGSAVGTSVGLFFLFDGEEDVGEKACAARNVIKLSLFVTDNPENKLERLSPKSFFLAYYNNCE